MLYIRQLLTRTIAPGSSVRRLSATSYRWKGQVLTADSNSFKKLVEDHPGRIMVDFTAEWCGPCRMIKPYLKKFIEEQGTIDLVVVDIDQAPKVAEKYSVSAVPTVKVFDNGKEVDGFVGNIHFNNLKDFVAKHGSLVN
ncbi:hypothetical protein IWQ62_005476 [Dispira parvispora]|uniref:Thioredoxin domain-containing protein n=1 Tax=Dispira parvispora TaxID=1520584 RepID=A0A9W8APW3_9FUNG|nr:hypothetical protein IWQ62_005476 [Dispira parvispora]